MSAVSAVLFVLAIVILAGRSGCPAGEAMFLGAIATIVAFVIWNENQD